MAINNPSKIINSKFVTGLRVVQINRHTSIIACKEMIHDFLWPIFCVKKGIFTRSIIGAQIKLIAYTLKIRPAHPIVLLDNS